MRTIGPYRRIPLALALAALVTLFAAPVFAGVCNGGPANGRSCFYNSECGAWCASGPAYQRSCFYDSECGKTCASGPAAGRSCFYDSECGKTCLGGSAAGRSCFYDWECPGSGCGQHYCKQHYCQKFYCSGGFGFTAGATDEQLAVCLDEIFAPAEPAAE